ncbi:MAG: hypothetical protein NXH70_02405 [Hyphomonas sp.]|nr:hypothetical protein [Hyphomonas sp.]
MKFEELLAATEPTEFCLRYPHLDKPQIWATSHPNANREGAVCFYVENGGWWGYLYADGRITDDEAEDPFELAAIGGSVLVDRTPYSGTMVPFPAWHEYEIEDVSEFLEDEIPF